MSDPASEGTTLTDSISLPTPSLPLPTTTNKEPFTSDDSQGGKSADFVVPVVAVLAGIVILVSLLIWRYTIKQRANVAALGRDRTREISAEELAGTSGSPTRRGGRGDGESGNVSGNGEGGDATTPGRPRRGRRVRVRRTDSGRSIRTLPEYSKEARDEEVVLVRQSMSSFDEETETRTDPHPSTRRRPSVADLIRGRVDSLRRSASMLSLSSLNQRPRGDSQTGHGHVGDGVNVSAPIQETGETLVQQGEDENGTTVSTEIPPSGTPLQRLAPPYHPRRTATSLAHGITRGDAPTYLEAMSSPSLDEYNNIDNNDARASTMRERKSSGIRHFLSRAHLLPHRPNSHSQSRSSIASTHHLETLSSTHLLPSTSRLSTPSLRSAPLPPSSFSHPLTLTPLHPFTSRTSNSTHSLIIGSPIPSTAIRASFDLASMPRAGLSDDQMRFLSSSEAVNLAGVRMEDPPPPRWRRSEEGRRRRSVTGATATVQGGDGSTLRPATVNDTDTSVEANIERGQSELSVQTAAGSSSASTPMLATTNSRSDAPPITGSNSIPTPSPSPSASVQLPSDIVSMVREFNAEDEKTRPEDGEKGTAEHQQGDVNSVGAGVSDPNDSVPTSKPT